MEFDSLPPLFLGRGHVGLEKRCKIFAAFPRKDAPFPSKEATKKINLSGKISSCRACKWAAMDTFVLFVVFTAYAKPFGHLSTRKRTPNKCLFLNQPLPDLTNRSGLLALFWVSFIFLSTSKQFDL